MELANTPTGNEMAFIERLFSREELDMLKMMKTEKMQDLENSIYMNHSMM